MKPAFLLAVLLLLGVVMASVLQPAKSDPASDAHGQSGNGRLQPDRSPLPGIDVLEGKSPEQRTQEFRQTMTDLDASIAKKADLLDEKMLQKTVNAIMSRRQPEYERFFKDNAVDPKTAGKVLETIRSRESTKFNELVRSMKETPAEVGNYKDSAKVLANARKNKSSRQSLEMVADAELLALLGPERYQSFKNLETRLKASFVRQAQSAGQRD